MLYKALYILIEGDADERFFQRIIRPKLEEKHNSVILWKYAQEPKKRVDNFLKSIRAMRSDYIYCTDINRAPCVTAKKQETQGKQKRIDKDRIVVVIKAIESWYLAGLDDARCKELGISLCASTDDITKEQFNGLMPPKFRDSRIDFTSEILKRFSIEIAKQKNMSFKYFLEKYDCGT